MTPNNRLAAIKNKLTEIFHWASLVLRITSSTKSPSLLILSLNWGEFFQCDSWRTLLLCARFARLQISSRKEASQSSFRAKIIRLHHRSDAAANVRTCRCCYPRCCRHLPAEAPSNSAAPSATNRTAQQMMTSSKNVWKFLRALTACRCVRFAPRLNLPPADRCWWVRMDAVDGDAAVADEEGLLTVAGRPRALQRRCSGGYQSRLRG